MENKFVVLESSMNAVLNINFGIKIRLQELGKIEEYARGLLHMTGDQAAMLGAVLKAFRTELENEVVSEECIGGYYRMLRECLSFNRSPKGKKCIIYGDNWLSREITKKMISENYCVFNWQMVNPDYVDEYDLHIVCDEAVKEYGIHTIPNQDKVFKVWDYLKYKFTVFPAFYKNYKEFKKKDQGKVKCVITGNANIAHAARNKQMHMNTVSLANNGQDIYYDFQMFHHACESMLNLKFAVIGLTPDGLRYDASRSRVEWRRCLVYYPIVGSMHNCEESSQLVKLFESEQEKIQQLFDEDYIEELYQVFEVKRKLYLEEKDTVFQEETANHEMDTREISELYNRPHSDIPIENKAILEDYVRYCREKGIQAIFLIPPYTRWYKQHMDISYYTELSGYIQELSGRYGAHIIDLFGMDMDDSYFKDYANLNSIGAIKVASYINAILEG
ncbi:MAG: hypothetical protein IKM28_00620 [Lachnospiraceae bacterium]|nr:hypothetical protein [Lachnospiraceae bacterium]